MVLSIVLFFVGLILVIYSAEKLVEGTIGTSLSFGISAFLISVIFIGFDPENLVLGAVASYEGAAGIALGTIIGAAMVAIALAFGITALLAPMTFSNTPTQVLAVPIIAILGLGVLSLDGILTRTDGVLLLAGFILTVLYLVRLSRKGMDIKPTGEVAETLEKKQQPGRWKSAGLLILALAGVVAGSKLIVQSSGTILARLGLSETFFGMTILALLVSIEELARELPAALKGRPEISYGNVAGSTLAFFLFNAGIIALVQPVPVGNQVLTFHLPLSIITILTVSVLIYRKHVSRLSGMILVALYFIFFTGSFFVDV